MKAKVIELLSKLTPTIDYNTEENLIIGGKIDSLDIINIVTALEEAFNIEIEIDEIVPENFSSATTITEMIIRKVGE